MYAVGTLTDICAQHEGGEENLWHVHRDPKGGETDGHIQGLKNPPVPRRPQV